MGPLSALLSGAKGQSGGAAERLEEMIQALTGVAMNMHQQVEVMAQLFGPAGSLSQMEQRLATLEAGLQAMADWTKTVDDWQYRQAKNIKDTQNGIGQIAGWMSLSA